MVKRVLIRTMDLKPGMEVGEAIVDKGSRILIARGTILDDYLIKALLKLEILSIYISTGEEEPEKEEPYVAEETLEKIEELTVEDRSKIKLSESVKKRVSKGIQFLFNSTESESLADETKGIARELMKAITENDAIAVDIGTLKVSDEYTFKHSVDVAAIAMIIARKYGMDDEAVYEIGVAGLLHDVGKSKIPNEILNKAGRLTDEEFAFMKQHSLFGFEIVKDKEELSDSIKMGVLQHHEKINGMGYPQGVTADKINIYAKILAVADVYDALVTERPYKKAFSQSDAIEIIMSMTDELDIQVMRSFLESVILYPVGSTVRLSNGEKARVVENDSSCILRPKVVGLKTGKVYDLAGDINCASIIIQ